VVKPISRNPRAGGEQIRLKNKREHGQWMKAIHWCDPRCPHKDISHILQWDLKIQREFEAKNLGPPKKTHREQKVCIIISDDEPDEPLGKIDDDWSQDLWDDLVKNNPERWDIHDALRLKARKPRIFKLEQKRTTSAKH